VLLFSPPFDQTDMEPGYIKGYPPGMRENGGQYTHGAVWSAMALAMLGEHERAWEMFGMLNPILHGDSAAGIERYKVEPYVMAADVYSASQHIGRGGWTWYTGAAGWMYRLAVETLLGFERQGDQLRIKPRLPAAGWSVYRIHYRYRETFYHIEVRPDQQAAPVNTVRIRDDGVEQASDHISLLDDRHDHFAEVSCGAATPPAHADS
jgi:cellobiose phosphorylase